MQLGYIVLPQSTTNQSHLFQTTKEMLGLDEDASHTVVGDALFMPTGTGLVNKPDPLVNPKVAYFRNTLLMLFPEHLDSWQERVEKDAQDRRVAPQSRPKFFKTAATFVRGGMARFNANKEPGLEFFANTWGTRDTGAPGFGHNWPLHISKRQAAQLVYYARVTPSDRGFMRLSDSVYIGDSSLDILLRQLGKEDKDTADLSVLLFDWQSYKLTDADEALSDEGRKWMMVGTIMELARRFIEDIMFAWNFAAGIKDVLTNTFDVQMAALDTTDMTPEEIEAERRSFRLTEVQNRGGFDPSLFRHFETEEGHKFRAPIFESRTAFNFYFTRKMIIPEPVGDGKKVTMRIIEASELRDRLTRGSADLDRFKGTTGGLSPLQVRQAGFRRTTCRRPRSPRRNGPWWREKSSS
jgi:hypothetical protein